MPFLTINFRKLLVMLVPRMFLDEKKFRKTLRIRKIVLKQTTWWIPFTVVTLHVVSVQWFWTAMRESISYNTTSEDIRYYLLSLLWDTCCRIRLEKTFHQNLYQSDSRLPEIPFSIVAVLRQAVGDAEYFTGRPQTDKRISEQPSLKSGYRSVGCWPINTLKRYPFFSHCDFFLTSLAISQRRRGRPCRGTYRQTARE